MRLKRERDPLRAARTRAAALEAEAIAVRMQECAWIAVWLRRQNGAALDAAAGEDREALEAAFAEGRRRTAFARLFATWGLLHLDCGVGACKRARFCAHPSLRCTWGGTLSGEQETHARMRFQHFIQIVSEPESEAEKALEAQVLRGAA